MIYYQVQQFYIVVQQNLKFKVNYSNKTKWYFLERDSFLEQLRIEIKRHILRMIAMYFNLQFLSIDF